MTTVFRYDGRDVAQETSGEDAVAYLRSLNIDEALVRTDAEAAVHYLADALGSTVALTDGSGTAATNYTFEPFGRTEVSGTANANPFQFTGRENDGTGLYSYRARYYDPVRSRFIINDPIGLRGGPNAYVYVDNRPLRWVDPKGLQASSGSGTAQAPQPPAAPSPQGLTNQTSLWPQLPPYPKPNPSSLSCYSDCMETRAQQCAYSWLGCPILCIPALPTGPGYVGCALGCSCTFALTCIEMVKAQCKTICDPYRP